MPIMKKKKQIPKNEHKHYHHHEFFATAFIFFVSIITTTTSVEATSLLSSSFVHSQSSSSSLQSNNNRMTKINKMGKHFIRNNNKITFVTKTNQHPLCSTYNNEDIDSPSSSASFALDPESPQAKAITSKLNISPTQHELLIDLSHLVVEWNERLNLISRKDCTVEVVFGRHVLPSVALVGLHGVPFSLVDKKEKEDEKEEKRKKRVVDVGTGGGFPGLPLAILNPDVDFMLVDSVGKKLKAVEDMAQELGLKNVQTHHGRAEEMKVTEKYDACVGRSVAALPKFCFWISDLLKQKEGKLVYIIGGDIESSVSTKVSGEISIDELLDCEGASDKRALIFMAEDVVDIAKDSGFKKKKVGVGKVRSNPKRKNKEARGGWVKRDNASPKQRGYDNFKRYDSSSSSF